MSRLTELLARLETKDPDLAAELREQVKSLVSRKSFGLTFEQHLPETVLLPGRSVRHGDKVRITHHVGTPAGEQTWRVLQIVREKGVRTAVMVDATDPGAAEIVKRAVADLVVVADFRDPIYPGLRSTGKVELGGNKPYSAVIKAENFHALETMMFAYAGGVDLIDIDPPYNTGSTQWLSLPSVLRHATRSSGCCSTISASHSWRSPPNSATQ